MPNSTLTLNPDSNIRVQFPVPKKQLIEFDVEAERPVDTYVVDNEGLAQFDSGEEFVQAYGGLLNKKKHHQEIGLPFRGSWWLLIVNRDEKSPVAVHYDVFW